MSFSNFHRLNESSSNQIRACKSAFRGFGKILGKLSYIDYENVSAEQENHALNYVLQQDQVNAVPQAEGLHNYMNKLRHFYIARQGINGQ